MTDPAADAAKLLLAKHRRHVELSPGVGADAQRYALAVLDDVITDLENTRPQPAQPDARMEAVFKAAIALSRQWNLEGGKFDEALFGKVEDLHKAICGLYSINPVEGFNARDLTQPAPPAGEPDFEALAAQYLGEYDMATSLGLQKFGQQMYRLGLAARPKVGDAELTEVIDRCRRYGAGQPGQMAPWPEMTQAANLLERLAVELADAYRNKSIIAEFFDRADKRAGVAEVKLAEREAELAKADAVAVKLRIGPPLHTNRQFWEKEYRPVQERHAARQQQKDKQ